MPLRCCAMTGRGREEEEEEEEEEEQRRRRRAAASAAVAMVPRRGRWLDGEQPQQAAAAQVAAGWRCRSCAAAAIADCVALGCCPCAVVALAGLALVRAPLAVGRRLRRRRRSLLHRQRVRDVAASSSASKATGTARARDGKGVKAAGAAPGAGSGTMLDPAATVGASPVRHHQQQQGQAQAEEELAWVDEMYRVGHWGFGRVSFSTSAGKTP